MSYRVPFSVFMAMFLIVFCTGQAGAQESTQQIPHHLLKPTHENIQLWRQHVLPAETDLVWQRIPWLTTFADGVLAANEADKPLLLWTMNGHPLGCT